MDYYEELGLDRFATEEDIRKAHRRLVKLLHPDRQTDDAVKPLAETQLRRLNGIVHVLTNPQRRLQYDRDQIIGRMGHGAIDFRKPVVVSRPLFQFPVNRRQIVLWVLSTTFAAVVLTLLGVWSWENHSGPLFSDVQAYDSRPAESVNAASSRRQPDFSRAELPLGDWTYLPRDQDTKSGSYIPQSISLKLVPMNGKLFGEYRARYAAINKPMPPDVNFTLAPVDANGNKFLWRAPNGSEGVLKIVQVSDDLIRISWETTIYTRDSLITSGVATLERQTS